MKTEAFSTRVALPLPAGPSPPGEGWVRYGVTFTPGVVPVVSPQVFRVPTK